METLTGNVNSLAFNHDNSRFIASLTDGFVVYENDPLKVKIRRHTFPGGVKLSTSAHKSNLIALVGTGFNPDYPANTCYIWDDKEIKIVGSINVDPDDEIIDIIIRKWIVAVMTRSTIYIYLMYNLSEMGKYNTAGSMAISGDDNYPVIAYTDVNIGKINIEMFSLIATNDGIVTPHLERSHTIDAHTSNIETFSLNSKGNLLASASSKGTLIRIFDTTTGMKLQEVRRGLDIATINNIAFSAKSTYLAVSSDKETIHVYTLKTTQVDKQSQNKQNVKSSFSFVSSVLPAYFSSEWSFAQQALPVELSKTKYIMAFGQDEDKIILISADGNYFRYKFNLLTGKMQVNKRTQWYNP